MNLGVDDAPRVLALVACVAQKRAEPAAARDLYCSPWFRLARQYVEAQGWPWRILSAHYGLIDPDLPIAPYDATLLRMPRVRRQQWAGDVLTHLDALCVPTRIVFLAGQHYREFLVEPLRERGHTVELPMRGLRIGEQLAWLKQYLKNQGIYSS